jgi:hypothetical protein
MNLEDTHCGSLAIGKRQGQPMGDVRPDRLYEPCIRVPVEEHRLDCDFASRDSSSYSVHTIQDAHGSPMNQDGW